MAETTTILYVVAWWLFVAAWLLSRYIEHLRDGTYHCVRRLRLARTLWVWDHQRTTPLSILGIVAYVGLNVGFILARSRTDLESVRRRAGLTAVTNLVPLFLGSKVCAVSDALGVTLQRYYFMHHWFGRLALVEAWVHTGMQIPHLVQWDFHAISGVLVSGSGSVDAAVQRLIVYRQLRSLPQSHFHPSSRSVDSEASSGHTPRSLWYHLRACWSIFGLRARPTRASKQKFPSLSQLLAGAAQSSTVWFLSSEALSCTPRLERK